MSVKVFAVIDVGTQSLRASLIDAEGNIRALERESYQDEMISPKPGYCEQNPELYWKYMVSALKRLTSTPFFKTVDLLGVTLCDFRDTAALLGKDLEPVRPSILWLDPRNAKLEKDHNLSWLYKIALRMVGMMPTARYNAKRTAAQWLKENEPDTWHKIVKYVPLSAYFNYKLTGKLVASSADCIGHYPLDFKRGVWLPSSNVRWQVFGVEREKLCDLVPVGLVIGKITSEASYLTGLPYGTPLYASASDKACEVLGNGCLDEEYSTISYGTACTVDLVHDKYINSEPFLPAYQAPIKGFYDMEVQIYRGFWMLKWFSDNFSSDLEKRIAKERGVSVENIFDQKIESIPAGSGGLIVQPFWGAGLRRPNARGAMIGFSDVQNKYYIYRAIIEGMAYSLREGLETLERRSHTKTKNLVVSGGGSRSNSIQQITADVFGLLVLAAETTESCSVGSAIGAFLACKYYTDPKEAVSKMVRYSKKLLPDERKHKLYNKYYKNAYTKLYPRVKEIDASLKMLSTDSEIG